MSKERGEVAMQPMRVLITNVQLTQATGTEIVTRDLALELARRGHEVAVYSPSVGPPADTLRGLGIAVVNTLDAVPFEPDVIHGHHHTPTIDAVTHFPDAPAIWVCHDRLQYEDIPPLHPSIRAYVAVDFNCRGRLLSDAGLAPELVSVIHNAVDLERFPWRIHPVAPPRRALVFSNQARPGGFLDAIVAACGERSISVDVVGDGVGARADAPESLLGNYDLVFGKARCALEAIVSGCAVVLIDHAGFGGAVTTSTMAQQRDWNFGARCLQATTTPAVVGAAIDSLDMSDAAEVTRWMRSVASTPDAVDRYEALYEHVARLGVGENNGRSPLQAALDYAGHVERRARTHSTPVGFPLPPGVNHGLRLRLLSMPLTVEPGDAMRFDVELTNHSSEVLASLMPNPVHVGHRWRPTEGGASIEGERAVLPAPLHPGGAVVLHATAVAPSAGSWLLDVTVVQEFIAWHDHLEPPLLAVARIDVRSGSHLTGPCRHRLGHLLEVTSSARATPTTLVRDGDVATLAFADDLVPGALAFAGSPSHLAQALAGGPGAVITTEALAADVPLAVGLAVSDDPMRSFYELHNALAADTAMYGERRPTRIDATAVVHPAAVVDPIGVQVGARTRIGPGVTLHTGTVLGEDVRIDAGAIIGGEAFQVSARSGDYLELRHVGGVHIGDHTHVHAGAIVAQGPLSAPTVIGQRCQIGNGAFVSHQCLLGHHVFVGHHATVNGRVTIGDGAWVGPGAVVSDRLALGDGCEVALGSVVIHDVAAGARVAGLPALDRYTMFRHAVAVRRGRS
jgi:UDP-3-O-[3-hydroxymyristoyl] glucosamine N-acyltransferase